MRDATGSTYGFLADIFRLYLFIIQDLIKNPDIPPDLRYILLAVYSVAFITLLFLLFWFLKFLIALVARGIAAFFSYLSVALDNPRSIPYVSILVLVQTVPWYFSLLCIILAFCGIAALLTDSPVWTESFKYIMGATVGSLIGVVKKQEQVEVEGRLYGLLEQEAAKAAGKAATSPSPPGVTTIEEKPQGGS